LAILQVLDTNSRRAFLIVELMPDLYQ